MYGIYRGDVLIGQSALEGGDPPMGVASGRFEPCGAFDTLRCEMAAVRDGSGKEQRDMRFLSGLSARTEYGQQLVCSGGVEVIEYGEANAPFGLEVFCQGIEQPPYVELFPDRVKAYEDQFKK